MEDQSRTRPVSVGLIAGLSALIMAAGGGAAWLAWQTSQPDLATRMPNATNSTDFSTTKPPQTQVAQPAQEELARPYWLQDTGKGLETVPNQTALQTDLQPEAALKAAFAELLAGPKAGDTAIATTLPQGTKLRSLTVEPDGIHIDFSEEFTQGGGSASMTGRVAQVLYTATSLQADAKVWLSVNGELLETLGGEGLLLEQPFTRQSFARDFPL
ncbi:MULTISPECIES: GerMN domain-containing protein [Trichocoleus]|uniref:GerMN domain-containing protein n=1 Tax=Trichocoleus desertorum GB2-A4 TaxID=2933944 RepID=A0ABV0JAA1_9CYAN|nr:GerMN domain-containing protein [Trichocoleus sp. FACHB-46]MBD1861416.1 GerMN domain-containing protein [Trichocoleus sp. FACHB-46]